MTATDSHELLHLLSSQEEADTKLILHAHEILIESSSKVAIHSPTDGTNISLFTLVQLHN